MTAALLAAGSTETALAFVEIGAMAFGLAFLSRLAGKIGLTAVPLYLVAGLAFGDGGIARVDVSAEFVELTAEIGVLLLLFTLGLEYSDTELRHGLQNGMGAGLIDMALNALPGVAAGLLLGWEPLAAVLLGGVTWISSSGIIAKVLADLGRLGNRETPAVLNLLVIEDLAMAVYLPVVAALIAGGTMLTIATSVSVALVTVVVILLAALRYGRQLSDMLAGGSAESLLLAVFGLTMLVAGGAQLLDVSGAIGAFLVGLALSGETAHRAESLIAPLRDLFAAVFFVSFTFAIDPSDLAGVALPAVALAAVTITTKLVTGWRAAGLLGVGPRGRVRAGAALAARGEFSIVIAALGTGLADGSELGALAAGYVLITAVGGPLLARYADDLPLPSGRARARRQPTPQPG